MATIALQQSDLGAEATKVAAQLGIRNNQFDQAPLVWRVGLVAMFAVVSGKMELAREWKARLKLIEEGAR